MSRPPLLKQAPVKALDANGTVVALIGTALFAIAAVVMGVQRDALAAQGRGWWFWVAVTGVIIGLLGTAYAHWRRTRR